MRTFCTKFRRYWWNARRCRLAHHGEVSEWSNVPDSKSGVALCVTVGSNPTLSAKQQRTSARMFFVIFWRFNSETQRFWEAEAGLAGCIIGLPLVSSAALQVTATSCVRVLSLSGSPILPRLSLKYSFLVRNI